VKLIAVNNDKQHIQQAFKSVQLICMDFLSTLSSDFLDLFIETIGCYGSQTADLNVALIAINLLMNISDHIAKEANNLGTFDTTQPAQNGTMRLHEYVLFYVKCCCAGKLVFFFLFVFMLFSTLFVVPL
jgi:hypothetical protein